jgi:hypothetical protein
MRTDEEDRWRWQSGPTMGLANAVLATQDLFEGYWVTPEAVDRFSHILDSSRAGDLTAKGLAFKIAMFKFSPKELAETYVHIPSGEVLWKNSDLPVEESYPVSGLDFFDWD